MASSSHKTTTVFEQIHVGNLTLTVDDPEFAYAVQCGILFAQHHYHKSTVSMREVLQRLVERLEDEMDENGHIEDYTRPLGEIFGEISHLLTGIKRLHVYFNPYGSTRPIE